MTADQTASAVVNVRGVSDNYFSVLGVSTVLGRPLDQENESVAVVSSSVWTNTFQRRADVIGSRVIFNGAPFTIVGVAGPEFFGESVGESPDFWVPLGTQPQIAVNRQSVLERRDNGWLKVMARLPAGMTIAEYKALRARRYVPHLLPVLPRAHG